METSATPDHIDHTRRARHLRAYLELFSWPLGYLLLNVGVTVHPPSLCVPYRYVASMYNGRRHWLEFDDDLAQLVLTLAEGVVGVVREEPPRSPEDVLDLDTGQRLPVGISTSVWLPEKRTLLVQSVSADLLVNRQ